MPIRVRLTDYVLAVLVGGPVRAVAWGAAFLGALGWLVSWWATLGLAAACIGGLWWWSRPPRSRNLDA